MKIGYANTNDTQELYGIWQDIFADPKRFADHYFAQKIKENKVITAKESDVIIGMLHLNPYRFMIGTKERCLHYIVGVATLPQARRKGVMKSMLVKAIEDMEANKEPFTYLMPADEAYYAPFDFTFIQNRYELSTEVVEDPVLKAASYQPPYQTVLYKDCDKELFFQMCLTYFKAHMQVYVLRNAYYWDQLETEVASEDGNIAVVYQNNEICGYFVYTKDQEQMYIREMISLIDSNELMEYIIKTYETIKILFLLDDIHQMKNTKKKATIMARITNLEQFLSLCHGVGNKGQIIVDIKDWIIANNNGRFKLIIESGKIKALRTTKEPELALSIGDLTSLLFGYDRPKIYDKNRMTQSQVQFFQRVSPLSKVFISEIV